MKKRTIIIGMFILFLVGVISIIGTYAIDSTITEGSSSTADYLFNITLGDRTNREVVIPSYDSKIVDIKISNPNEFTMSYLLYIEGVNSNISVINIKDTEASGVLASKTTAIIQIFIQNNSNSDITIKIKDIVGFEKETLTLPDNSTSINKGNYYKAIVKSNNNTYGKVKPNIKLSTLNGTVKYKIVPNTGYEYKSNTCNGTIVNNILTISNITSNVNCEVVFEPIEVTVSLDLSGGEAVEATYTEAQEHTYTVSYNGTYKLETWGAQGGYANSTTYRGGYGGYSTGTLTLNVGQKLYVNVGGKGSDGTSSAANITSDGGYNGGGSGINKPNGTGRYAGGGGGATHIATISGELEKLSSNISSILIVSGGGAGNAYYNSNYYVKTIGDAGGYLGVSGVSKYSSTSNTFAGGGQSSDYGYEFGLGQSGTSESPGGGGGYFGGKAGVYGAGGGSGYIGNSLLTDKYMYCYNCSTSDDEATKTYTTTNVSSTPTSDYAKSGDGAARITLIDNANYVVSYGQNYGTLPIPTKEGYVFGGWYTGENGTGTKITENTVLSNTNNHTLYAFWIPPITVSFDPNGGDYGSYTYTETKIYTYSVPYNGEYRIELWGASGGGENGGKGGYTAGTIYLNKDESLFIGVGGVGPSIASGKNVGGFNGGGYSGYLDGVKGYGGGGATDVRLVSGAWNNAASLKSRIMVAAGGAGTTSNLTTIAGSGGGLIGGDGTSNSSSYNNPTYLPLGSTQTAAGYSYNASKKGSFGYAVQSNVNGYGGGGGGGYYGGNTGHGTTGSGGSSYISGHTGCVAIVSDSSTNPRTGTDGISCVTGTTDNLCSVHYSGKVFSNTVMIDGTGYSWTTSKGDLQLMPKVDGTTYDSGTGHSGNGIAKITFIDDVSYTTVYGQKYNELPIPARDGYVFLGWYTEREGGVRINSNSTVSISNNHILYAHWGEPSAEYTTSGEYTFTASHRGTYKLEVWGAQGGTAVYSSNTYRGGYGGYSTGNIKLAPGDILYVNVGGAGTSGTVSVVWSGGYNGGGSTVYQDTNDKRVSSGGGATHIAIVSGELSTLSSNKDSILIVAGGGGGGYVKGSVSSVGGDGGGYQGGNATTGSGNPGKGGSQTAGGSYNGGFGSGGKPSGAYGSAGGGGFYGGGGSLGTSGSNSGGGGGSGYIGNSLLTDKYMYCYNCSNTSDEEATKTYSTPNVSSEPISNYAKGSDGAARITLISINENPPEGTISVKKEYNNIIVNIDATDDAGIDHYEYYLSTSTTCPTDGYTISDSNSYTYDIAEVGTYYVCARVVDVDNKVLSLVSQSINYSRIYSVIVRYNVNGGTITPNTSSYTWTTDDTGLIYQNGNVFEQVIRHGTPADLVDYNNSEFINITSADLFVVPEGEWKCLSGCNVPGKKFNQAIQYNTSDFCDVTNNNCTVVLGLNLVTDIEAPTCTLSANSSTITAIPDDNNGVESLLYYGWDSSYSGDNSTSKSIATGTHTYYVKDSEGNTGSCSITIAGTTKSCPSGYWLENNDTICYKGWYVAKGSCNCRNNEGTSVSCLCKVSGSSAVAQCQSLALGAAVVSNSCYSGIDYVTADISYTCSSGYTQINNSYCYK